MNWTRVPGDRNEQLLPKTEVTGGEAIDGNQLLDGHMEPVSDGP